MKNLIRRILKESIEEFDWVQQDVKQFNPAEQFLYDLMSELKMVESNQSPGWMLYKDKMGENLMADNINTGVENPVLFVKYDRIWLKLNDNYGLGYNEAMALCIRVLEMTHKRKVSKAQPQWFMIG